MKQHVVHGGLGVAFGAALFFAQAVSAAPLNTGSFIKLADSYGNTGGGEFIASIVGGSAGDSFITFCLERNEYFTPGQTLRVGSVTDSAMSGGVSGGNPDPISSRTAWLYTTYRAGGLSDYSTGTNGARVSDANSMQRAIWYLEGEITVDDVVGGLAYKNDTQAKDWVQAADDAVANGWSGIGQVRVLNLWRESSVGSGNFNAPAQDQLYITPVPEPETYMMLLAGLGLMGFVARRRQRSFAG